MIILFRILRWIESKKKKKHLFCNIINLFTVTDDQFNVSVIKKKSYYQTFERYIFLIKQAQL